MAAVNWILVLAIQAGRVGERKCCGRIPYNLFKTVLFSCQTNMTAERPVRATGSEMTTWRVRGGKERPPGKVTAERQIEDPNRTLKPTPRGHYLSFGRIECG
jgi:hypothetical protein